MCQLIVVRATYSRIISTNSQSFCMATCSASLTILKALLPQSQDCRHYVSRRKVALPPLRLQTKIN